MVDIANFFRFEEDFDNEFLKSFISGYQSAGGKLPKDWRKVVKILDLASMSNFITRSDNLDTSSQTAIKVFKKTIELL